MHAFRARGPRDNRRYSATLELAERRIVGGLMAEVVVLLDPPEVPDAASDPFGNLVAGLGAEQTPSVPEDPALARLLPTGHLGQTPSDAAAAAEFRRLTEGGLRRRKAENLQRAIRALRESDSVDLDRAGAHAFAAALTDVRLVLAERLGLQTEEDQDALHARAEREGDHELGYALSVYEVIGWLQETLTGALLQDHARWPQPPLRPGGVEDL